jgi:STE24 endopeptidase
LFFVSALYDLLLPVFGFTARWEIAALPLFMLIAGTLSFFMSPVGTFISRKFEFEADRFAIATTGRFDVFKSTMEKLAFQNLSDDEPPRLVEYWFHSHPSVNRRIERAEDYHKSLAAANA